MRKPSRRMTPNTAWIRRVESWDQDAAGGRRAVKATGRRGPYLCAVQPTSSEDKPDHMRESGVEYVDVKFYQDPQVLVRDQVEVGERVYVVTECRTSSGGAGRSWVVGCEYRAPGAAARVRPA